MNEQVNNESKNFFSMLFSFRGIINRQEYLIYGVVIPLIIIGVGFYYLYLNIIDIRIFQIFILLGVIIQLATTVKRARDRDENIVVLIIALLLFSPIVILYLLFAPSKGLEERKNQKSRGLFYILLGLSLLIILGLFLSKIMTNSHKDVHKQLVCIQMKGISNDLKMFQLDMGKYPTTEEGLEPLLTSSYLSRYPLDSWGHELKYMNKNNTFELISYGKDGIKSSDDILFSECQKKITRN